MPRGFLTCLLVVTSLTGTAQAQPPRAQITVALARCEGKLTSAFGCSVLGGLKVDEAALLDAQAEAVALGGQQVTRFARAEGDIVLTTRSLEVPASSDAPAKVCRMAESEVERQGIGLAPLGAQLYCKTAAGLWRAM